MNNWVTKPGISDYEDHEIYYKTLIKRGLEDKANPILDYSGISYTAIGPTLLSRL